MDDTREAGVVDGDLNLYNWTEYIPYGSIAEDYEMDNLIAKFEDEYDAHADFGYAVPNEGGVVWVDNMAIPTTAESPCTAHAFINFILDAENGATLTNYNYYASPNAAPAEYIYPEILDDPAFYPPQELFDNGSLEFLRIWATSPSMTTLSSMPRASSTAGRPGSSSRLVVIPTR